MRTEAEIRQKLIGEVLPYVFIESIVIDESPAVFREDTLANTTSEPEFIKNEYGTNKQVVNTGALEDKEEGQFYKISLKISMNDLLNNSIWFNTPARTAMKVKVFQATSKAAFELASSAGFTDLHSLPSSIRPHLKEKIISIPNHRSLTDYATRQIDGFDDVLCTIKMQQDFYAKSNYLGFVAFPYIDVPPLYGSKNIQKVLNNGKLISSSFSYYSPDGSLWKGPVHMHPDRGVMEGKVHSARPHSTLTVVEHENKINDLRIFNKFLSLQGDIRLTGPRSKKRNYSDLFLTGDSQGIVKGFFAFDFVGFLAENSVYNGLMNKRNLKKLMSLTNIQKFSVYRDGLNDYEAGDAAISNVITKSSSDRVVLATYSPDSIQAGRIPTVTNTIDDNNDGVREKKIGSIREVVISGMGSKRSFSFVDHDISHSDGGSYIYGVELDATDPTKKLLELQILALREARKQILSYYEEAKQPGNFNAVTGQFKHEYLSYLKKIYNLDIRIKGTSPKLVYTPWRLAPKIYFDALETLLGSRVRKSDKKLLQKTLYPSTGDLGGVEKFISLLDSLIVQLREHESVQAEAKSRASGKSNAKIKDGTLKSQKLFEDRPWRKTQVKDAGYHLNYLQGALRRSQDSLVRVNRNSLISRFNVEVNKFFPEVVGKRENEIVNDELKGSRKTYFSYLTPTVVEAGDDKIVLSKQNDGSYEKVSQVLSRRRHRASTGASSIELLKSMGVTVSSRKSDKPSVGGGLEASDYFGDNTSFTAKKTDKAAGEDRIETSVEDAKAEEIRNVLIGSRRRSRTYEANINKNDSLQKRYLKMLQRDSLSNEQEAEVDVLEQTTVSMKYVTGFDSKMEPMYSTSIPQSANSVLYVIETEDENSEQRDLISDSIGLVDTSGGQVSAEKLKEEDPCDDIVIVQEEPDASSQEIVTENPCPDGYNYNYNTGECEPFTTNPPASPVDDKDPPSEDVQPETGQAYQDPPSPMAQPQMAGQSTTTAVPTTAVPTSEQQQGYFVRRASTTTATTTTTTSSPVVATTTTGGSTSGGGYDY